MKLKWEPLTDCDDEETEEHTCWAAKTDNPKYEPYVWITKTTDDYFNTIYKVEMYDNDFIPLCVCKSLVSAKRWAAMNCT